MNPAVEKEFISFINANLYLPFEWGRTDCNILSAKAAGIVSQKDFSSWIEGKYFSKLQAARFFRSLGDIKEVVRSFGGFQIQEGHRRNGDLVLSPHRLFCCLHVFVNGRLFSSGPDTGVILADYIPIPDATYWRPPCHQLSL